MDLNPFTFQIGVNRTAEETYTKALAGKVDAQLTTLSHFAQQLGTKKTEENEAFVTRSVLARYLIQDELSTMAVFDN